MSDYLHGFFADNARKVVSIPLDNPGVVGNYHTTPPKQWPQT
jgi:hypothetical protein